MTMRCRRVKLSAALLRNARRDRVLRTLKEKAKHHLNRQLLQAAKDIDSTRQFPAAQESAEFVDQHMAMAKSYPDKFALIKASIAQIEVPGLYSEFGVYRGETINFIASQTGKAAHEYKLVIAGLLS